jgi:hypothetical protein
VGDFGNRIGRHVSRVTTAIYVHRHHTPSDAEKTHGTSGNGTQTNVPARELDHSLSVNPIE